MWSISLTQKKEQKKKKKKLDDKDAKLGRQIKVPKEKNT